MPPNDPLVDSLRKWTEIFMHRSMRNFIRYARESGLSMSQLGALFHIQHGISGVTDLGEDIGITNAAASQMLERLVQMQLIQRSEDPHDRRVKQIVLTEKGQMVVQESIHARLNWFDDLAAMLSEGEKGQIVSALEILVENANRFEFPSE
jgi:DNA-binding MarR family transcriptional regulator